MGPQTPYRGGEAPRNHLLESPGLPPALLPPLGSLIGLESPGGEASPVQAGTAPAPKGSGLGACQPGSSASSDAPLPSPKGPGLLPGKKRQRSCCRGTECAREGRRGRGARGAPHSFPGRSGPRLAAAGPQVHQQGLLGSEVLCQVSSLGGEKLAPGGLEGRGCSGESCRQSPRAALGRELSLEGCPSQTAGAGECPGMGLAPGPWTLLSESSPGRAIPPSRAVPGARPQRGQDVTWLGPSWWAPAGQGACSGRRVPAGPQCAGRSDSARPDSLQWSFPMGLGKGRAILWERTEPAFTYSWL